MATHITYVKNITFDGTRLPTQTASRSLTGEQTDISNMITVGPNGVRNYITGLIDVRFTGNGNLSSIQGYKAVLKKSGTSTGMTDEPAALVTGKIYRITDVAKRVLDPTVAVVIEDNGSPVSGSNIDSIDLLFGIVEFDSGYTPTGPITFTANYLPMAAIAQNNGSFEIQLRGDVLDSTDRPTAQSNGGLRVNNVSLIDSSATVSRFDDLSSDYIDLLMARTPVLIEFTLAGGALTLRGWYTLSGSDGEGAVDGQEMENLSFAPYGQSVGDSFGYIYTGSLNAGIVAMLDAFFARSAETVTYLPDGETGQSIPCKVSQLTLSGDMSAETFDFELVGAGAITDVP